MAQEKTLGGDRIGSGNQMKVKLHDYEMTSFNLNQDFRSSLAPGVLYPFLKVIGTNHDKLEIDLDNIVRTLPTVAPLFGSFKLQADLYVAPFRLYQGLLHNNPTEIGMNMGTSCFLPKIKFRHKQGARRIGSDEYNEQVNESALEKYLGLSGYGVGTDGETIERKIQCIPELAYYDIFKCYYANKQEKYAYYIGLNEKTATWYGVRNFGLNLGSLDDVEVQIDKTKDIIPIFIQTTSAQSEGYGMPDPSNLGWNAKIMLYCEDEYGTTAFEEIRNIFEWNNAGKYKDEYGIDQVTIPYINTIPTLPGYAYSINLKALKNAITYYNGNLEELTGTWYIQILCGPSNRWHIDDGVEELVLKKFELKNIDKMRAMILGVNEPGQEFVIDQNTNLYPYSCLVEQTSEGVSHNAYPHNGLVVKTYQSDLFNNWLDTEYVDGPNGIANRTAVAVTNGKFLLDSVNFAEKMYDLLNRILVSGGTYQDWQEARWGEGSTRMCETPIYVGGMSAEIVFEEIISSAQSGEEPLGTLAGKGTQIGKQGGNHIEVKFDEPGYLIGIVSITPRISYSQGNDWDRTELDTAEDLHAPAMDGIGFQDLMVEQMAWWDTKISNTSDLTRHSAGKQTAWINYQTAIDKCYGDFANLNKGGFMVLNRYYTRTEENEVADITTYIDPTKYNYAFAVTDLASQNFWVQIHSKIIARRKMAGQQIPVL